MSHRIGSSQSTPIRTPGRALHIASRRGRRQTEASWRRSHPNWNGHYYYRSGTYYYDAGFAYPAIVTNEWVTIADDSGESMFIVALGNDPTLFFTGRVGAFYALATFDADRHARGKRHLRFLYFDRPYFWRDGVRFVRISLTVGGQPGYEFRRVD